MWENYELFNFPSYKKIVVPYENHNFFSFAKTTYRPTLKNTNDLNDLFEELALNEEDEFLLPNFQHHLLRKIF